MMKPNLASLYLLCVLLTTFAEGQKRWSEENAIRLEIVEQKFSDSFATYTVRFSNLGLDPVYLAERVGTSSPASLTVEKLVDEKWSPVPILGDVRARCGPAIKSGNSLTDSVSFDRRVLPNDKPTKVRFGLIVYHTLTECKKATNGQAIFSFPNIYAGR